jgi:predicted lipid-binding transport protein (Tim44 family)
VVGIVIFALVAAFFGLRLYSVLGKRTGHEHPLVRAPDDVVRSIVPVTVESPRDVTTAEPDADLDPTVEIALRAISVADRTFNAADFIDGAKRAYRMILEGYWSGDESAFSPYVADDVRAAFSEAIATRKELGQSLENRLITIERTVISAASLNGGMADVVVRFDADIAAVTRDAEGRVIAGSLSDAVPTHDSWTFSRNVNDKNPNWLLTDTDEAE